MFFFGSYLWIFIIWYFDVIIYYCLIKSVFFNRLMDLFLGVVIMIFKFLFKVVKDS